MAYLYGNYLLFHLRVTGNVSFCVLPYKYLRFAAKESNETAKTIPVARAV